MKTQNTRMKLIAVVIALVALASVWAAWGGGWVIAIQDSEDMPSPFGLARGQTARLTVLNIGERAVVGPEYRLLPIPISSGVRAPGRKAGGAGR
jgi:hypothetical protein